MPSHEKRRPAQAASPSFSRTGSHQDSSDLLPVADGLRAILEFAGIDRVPLGIRGAGSLDWVPVDPVDQPEPPVAIARRAHLAHLRCRDIGAQLRAGRWIVARFGGDL